jgi:hypothetical protein
LNRSFFHPGQKLHHPKHKTCQATTTQELNLALMLEPSLEGLQAQAYFWLLHVDCYIFFSCGAGMGQIIHGGLQRTYLRLVH